MLPDSVYLELVFFVLLLDLAGLIRMLSSTCLEEELCSHSCHQRELWEVSYFPSLATTRWLRKWIFKC